ncbi:thiol-disulfide oxidoreductase DCC family protein [Nocardiopsis sp. NPDC058631]|uniref:thiol-disulfide oxidoreductase DCC family protein n=1 Tax=Nocardiopsis sp. NPDC058631 TaxID=3346566 RepID=UPI003662E843
MRTPPDTAADPGTFLFDSDCGFCRRAVSFARERVRARSRFVAWQNTDLGAFGLTPGQADEAAWLVYADGRRFRGGDAVAEVLLHGRPLTRPVGRMMRLPLLREVNRFVYRRVAANRHRLPGGTSACALDDPRRGGA